MGFRVPRPRRSPMPERPRGRIGLYDPSYEHDACGVAMVAKLDGKPSHEAVERAIVALENLEHRGAAGADPEYWRRRGNPAPVPRRVPARRHRRRAAAARRLRRRDAVPPARGGRARPAGSAAGADRQGRGPDRHRLARRPGRQGLRRHHGQPVRAVRQAARRGRLRGARGRPGRVRAQAVRDPPRRRARRRAGAGRAELQQPHDRLQGHADQPAAARLLPGPVTTRARRPRSRSCTRGSAPTRSRAGSSRTRSA